MAENGWQAKRMRAFKRTTISDDSAPIFEDLLKRDFTAQAPGTKLVGDITYLRTDQGWLYLATVIDLYTRMVISWSMAPHMKTTLIIDAMTMAGTTGIFRPALFSTPIMPGKTLSRAWCACPCGSGVSVPFLGLTFRAISVSRAAEVCLR